MPFGIGTLNLDVTILSTDPYTIYNWYRADVLYTARVRHRMRHMTGNNASFMEYDSLGSLRDLIVYVVMER